MLIRIRYPFALCCGFLLALFFDGTGIIQSSLLAVILHECGHALAYILLLRKRPMFQIGLGGISLHWNTTVVQPFKQTMILLAGPAANGIAAAICFAICARQLRLSLYLAGGINLLLGIFNLLPMGFLDGGRLLELILLRFISWETTWRCIRLLQMICLLLLTAFLLLFSADHTTRIALLLFLSYYCGKSFCAKN